MNDTVSNPNGEENQPVQTDQSAPAPVQAEPTAQVDPNSLFADQLSSIVADDGRQKYADVPTALSSIPHAQGRINELSSTVKELQEELAKRQGAEDLLASLQQSQQQVTEQPSVTGLDETAIESVVSNILQSQAQQQQQEANTATVKQTLIDKFGGAASVEFENRAKQLGMSVGQLTQMSAQMPQAVMELFNTVQVRDPQPTVGSAVNIPSTPVQDNTPDYMARFSGSSDNDTRSKWEAAKAEVAKNLN
jgi:uncharacterized protein YukE